MWKNTRLYRILAVERQDQGIVTVYASQYSSADMNGVGQLEVNKIHRIFATIAHVSVLKAELVRRQR